MDQEDLLQDDPAVFVMAVRNTFVEVSSGQEGGYFEGDAGMQTAPASLSRSLPSGSADFISFDICAGCDVPDTPSTPTSVPSDLSLWPPTPVTPGAPLAISLAELTEDPLVSVDNFAKISPLCAANIPMTVSTWFPPVQPPTLPPSVSQLAKMDIPAPAWVAAPPCL